MLEAADLAGAWTGISEESVYMIKLRLFTDGTGIFAKSGYGSGDIRLYWYRITSWKLVRGNVVIRSDMKDPPATLSAKVQDFHTLDLTVNYGTSSTQARLYSDARLKTTEERMTRDLEGPPPVNK